MAVNIGIVQINVTDLDRAKRFYGDILGYEITGGTSGVATIESNGGPALLLYPVKNAAPVDYPNQTGTTIVLYVDDIEKTVAEWRGRGVEFIPIAWSTDASGIADCPFGRFIAFRDPFGNVHEILQPGG
ncbi:MAG: Glyoxalase/bleomycin resistance protein/dioxygenase [Chlorobi bacterium]|nr:Glyoxalase/bleomycin resistance protein/dioxygenase [Chlorobiota bacterium]